MDNIASLSHVIAMYYLSPHLLLVCGLLVQYNTSRQYYDNNNRFNSLHAPVELTWALPDDNNDDIGIAYSANTLAVV